MVSVARCDSGEMGRIRGDRAMTWIAFGLGCVIGTMVGLLIAGLCIASRDDIEVVERDARSGRF